MFRLLRAAEESIESVTALLAPELEDRHLLSSPWLPRPSNSSYRYPHTERAPQLSHEPQSSQASGAMPCADPPSPMTENMLLILVEPHLSQVLEPLSAFSVRETKALNRAPQSSHLYCMMGISVRLPFFSASRSPGFKDSIKPISQVLRSIDQRLIPHPRARHDLAQHLR